MSRTVVKAPSGTVSPLILRTRIFEHVLGILRRYVAVGLRHDAEGAAEQIEVVDIGRAEIDLQRREDVGDIDAEQLRLGAVDVEIELRRRGLEQREHLLQAGRLRGRAHHGVGRGLQRLRPAPGAVLDHHAEAAGIADAAHRRRRHHHHQRVLDRREFLEQLAAGWRPADWSGRRRAGRTASSTRKIAPAFGALVKVAPEKPTMFTASATPGDLQRDVDRPAVDRVGAVERSARRQLR